MQNKNKVVLPEVGVSWRTTPNTKRSLNFLIFTTFSLVFQSYRKIKTKTAVFSRFFLFLLGFTLVFQTYWKIKTIGLFSQIFFFLKLHLFFSSNQKWKQRMLWFHEFFSHFLSILHRNFTHINNQNTVDNFCIILANCEAYTL